MPGLMQRLFGRRGATPQRQEPRFRASGDVGVEFNLDDPALADYLRGGRQVGPALDEHGAMRIAVSWRCVNLICGCFATLPNDLNVRLDETAREAAVNFPFRNVLTVRPNSWQTPGDFKRQMMALKLLRGNAYAYKVRSRGAIRQLLPLRSRDMRVSQNPDNSLRYDYSRLDGTRVTFGQGDILHLRGLSLDGITGLSVIGYHRETMGLAARGQHAMAKIFENGSFRSKAFKTAAALSDQAYTRLKTDIDGRKGVDDPDAMGSMILEEGLDVADLSMTAADLEFLAQLQFNRGDIGMLFGVPPHLYGDTDKSTSWGSGIEQQNIGFLQYTLQDHITAWGETIKRDCLSEPGDDPRLYVHTDLNGLLRADAATRSLYLSRALGSGGGRPWMTQNDVRRVEDMPKRPEKWADLLPEVGNVRITETSSDVDPNAPANKGL